MDNQLIHWTRRCGLPMSRFKYTSPLPHGAHLRVLGAIDVCLDTVLYNGGAIFNKLLLSKHCLLSLSLTIETNISGLTNADAIFAGVPVVHMPGPQNKWVQRMGGEWIVCTREMTLG